MWMKNTLIPLDMLFIDETGKIVRIEERTVPHSERAIVSGRPVSAVLELNAGTPSRLSIKPGDRVRHPAFATQETDLSALRLPGRARPPASPSSLRPPPTGKTPPAAR